MVQLLRCEPFRVTMCSVGGDAMPDGCCAVPQSERTAEMKGKIQSKESRLKAAAQFQRCVCAHGHMGGCERWSSGGKGGERGMRDGLTMQQRQWEVWWWWSGAKVAMEGRGSVERSSADRPHPQVGFSVARLHTGFDLSTSCFRLSEPQEKP